MPLGLYPSNQPDGSCRKWPRQQQSHVALAVVIFSEWEQEGTYAVGGVSQPGMLEFMFVGWALHISWEYLNNKTAANL